MHEGHVWQDRRWNVPLAVFMWLLAGVLLAAPLVTASAAELRVATWNIANLHHQPGRAIAGRSTVREPRHYEALRRYATETGADVVALQEVNSIEAIHTVFPAPHWQAFISGRQADDVATGRRTDGTYTGFAVRAGIRVLNQRDVEDIGVLHNACSAGSGVPMRRGLELEIEHEGRQFRLLSVHLKARCAQGALLDSSGQPIDRADNCHCVTLARQIEPLTRWISEAAADPVPFMILGDFNRAFDRFGARDHLWSALNDASELRLWRLPCAMESPCWRDVAGARHFRRPIDFLVFDERAWRLVDRESFSWVTFDPYWGGAYEQISDHCPVAATLRW